MAEAQRATVLVVDDTEANVDVLVEILSDDYEVSVAMDGPSALEIIESDLPDLILLDIMMPGMDGYEVCRTLKASERTRDVPVIFVTAMGEVQDETRGFEAGAVDYITKPISPQIVMSRVRSQLSLKKKTEQLADLSRKLSKYLAPQVYVSIFRGEQDVAIDSKRKKLTIFFSDIASFTQTTEGMEAEDLSELLNGYLEEMSNIAIKHGGTIDKFIGDAILVFFGDPLSRGLKEDAEACLNMALEMRGSVKSLQKKWYAFGIQEPFKVRMGIATGYCTVGNFGSSSRMDYTIIGSQVNIASRLQATADPDEIIISHETWSLVKELVYCIKQKPVMVKGISHPIQSYQVVDLIKNMSSDEHVITIGLLAEPALEIGPDTPVRELKMKIREDDPNSGTVVAEQKNSQPLGLLMSRHLARISNSEMDVAVYFDQPVTKIMDSQALIVESETPLQQVARQVSARGRQNVYDPVIVTENGALKGMVPVHSVFAKLLDLER